jgi:putative aldouronate transport system permease protein
MKKQKNRGILFNNDKFFDAFTLIVLTMVLIIVAYPLYFVIIASISDPAQVSNGSVMFIPKGLTLDGYKAVFKENQVVRGFLNSILYTSVGTFVNIVVTLPAAFALSRPNLKGKGFIMIFFILPMYISGGMIPTYLVVKKLNLYNSMWSLILPGAISIYNFIICRTFFANTIEQGLVEAAKIDGCSNSKFFFHIAMPLSKAILAIMVLYYGVNHWNAYFNSMIYISDKAKFPLQLILRTLLMKIPKATDIAGDIQEAQRQLQIAELMKYSLIIVSSIPVLILYPFVQKHFVKGVMIGSIKG